MILEVDFVDNMSSTEEIMLALAIIGIVALFFGMFKLTPNGGKSKVQKHHSTFNTTGRFTRPGRAAALARRNRGRR